MSDYEQMADYAQSLRENVEELEANLERSRDIEPYKLEAIIQDNLKYIRTYLHNIEGLL